MTVVYFAQATNTAEYWRQQRIGEENVVIVCRDTGTVS
jgi:hypothetical protein